MSNFIKPTIEKKIEVTHKRFDSENNNLNGNHAIQKILLMNNKTNNISKQFEIERENNKNHISKNTLELNNNTLINHNNVNKRNLDNNLIKVKTNNLNTINQKNDNGKN